MDDAQEIVLVALQQAGIQVPAAEAKQELGSSGLVSICAQAVALLRGASATTPLILPSPTAERFRVCTDLAGAIKLLGYQGDLSFHQFLYPSHTDMHRLLRFLLDQLSRSSGGSRTRKARTAPATRNRLSSIVHRALIQAHGSAHTAENHERDQELPFRTCPVRSTITKTVGGVVQKKPTLLTLQAKPRGLLIPSLLELNAKNVVATTGSADANEGAERAATGDVKLITRGEFQPEQFLGVTDSRHSLDREQLFGQEAESKWAGDAEINGEQAEDAKITSIIMQLQEQLRELVTQADEMEADAREKELHISVLKEQEEAGAHRMQQAEKETAVLRDAVRMALGSPTPPSTALENLHMQVTAAEEHLDALQAEWEAVRLLLEEKKAELEREALAGQEDLQEKLKKIKEMRQQLKQLSTKLRIREEQAWTLEGEVKEMGSPAKRSSYVHRITELVKNSQKQEKDIAKIITDTRELQRDSNAANDRLRRTHALVDELVFRDAKKDAVCRQAYRQLSSIHKTFADIVDKVMEMDKTGRDIAELQAQLEELQKSSLDVTSVQADLDAIAAENRSLEKRLAEALAT